METENLIKLTWSLYSFEYLQTRWRLTVDLSCIGIDRLIQLKLALDTVTEEEVMVGIDAIAKFVPWQQLLSNERTEKEDFIVRMNVIVSDTSENLWTF